MRTLQDRITNAIAYTQVLLKAKELGIMRKAYLEKILQLLKDIKGDMVVEKIDDEIPDEKIDEIFHNI